MTYWLSVLIQTPAHSNVAGPLTYRSEQALPPGTLVRVPLGAREMLGVVWALLPEMPPELLQPSGKPIDIKFVIAELGIAPLSQTWRQLIHFTASYYQRSLGEVALAALPPQLRTLRAVQVGRRLKRTSISDGET